MTGRQELRAKFQERSVGGEVFPVDGGFEGKGRSFAERPAALGDCVGVIRRVYQAVVGLQIAASEDVADGRWLE